MGLIQRITETVADGMVRRSPAYRVVETKLREASELLSIYSIIDPRYWHAVGSSERDMPADVRDTISRQAWATYETNPTAAGYVNNVVAFVVGPGFQITHPDERADAEVQDYIARDRFMTLASETLVQYLLTAEAPTLFFVNALSGDFKTRVVDPLEVYDVIYDADDNREVLGLRRRYTHRRFDLEARAYVDTNRDELILHDERNVEEFGPYGIRDFHFWKRPTLPNAQRGLSFLTPSLKWLAQYEKLLDARLALNRARATYARDLEIKGATKEECDARAAELNARGEPRPGAWSVHDDKTKFAFPAPNIGAGDAKDDLRAFLLMVVAGLSVPEFIATADASNANFASTTNVTQAFVKGIQKLQTDLTDGWVVPIFARLLRAKAEARRVSPEAAEIPVNVAHTEILPYELDKLVQALTWAVAAGVMSKEDALNILPWDLTYDAVKTRIAAERADGIKAAGGITDEHKEE